MDKFHEFSNTFSNKINLIGKRKQPKRRILEKAEKSKFPILFQLEFKLEKESSQRGES